MSDQVPSSETKNNFDEFIIAANSSASYQMQTTLLPAIFLVSFHSQIIQIIRQIVI